MKRCPKCGKRFIGEEEFCPVDGATLEVIEEQGTDLLIGTTLDNRYEIVKRLGEGGMGVVYEARHVVLGKKFAIKILRSDLSNNKEIVERFIQEAKAASSIGHENIIEVTDFGYTPDGNLYFVMEFLNGESLDTILQRDGKLPIQRSLTILRQVALALNAAHKEGIIHRDLKPENIFIVNRKDGSQFVKVLDFGIAKVSQDGTGSKLTRTGVVFGTPQYMSPEQAQGKKIDARSDIYSLGVVAYEMVTGRVPFTGESFMEIMTKHILDEPPPPSQFLPSIPKELENFILKCIAKKPEDRYQSMEEVIHEIDRLLVGGKEATTFEEEAFKKSGRGKFWIVGVALSLVIAVALVFSFFSSKNNEPHGRELKRETKKLVILKKEETSKKIEKKESPKGNETGEKPIQLTRNIIIESQPKNVKLYLNGNLLGITPYVLKFNPEKDKQVKIVAKKKGYYSHSFTVDRNSKDFILVKLHPKKRPKKEKKKLAKREVKKQDKQKLKKEESIKFTTIDGVKDPWAESK